MAKLDQNIRTQRKSLTFWNLKKTGCFRHNWAEKEIFRLSVDISLLNQEDSLSEPISQTVTKSVFVKL